MGNPGSPVMFHNYSDSFSVLKANCMVLQRVYTFDKSLQEEERWQVWGERHLTQDRMSGILSNWNLSRNSISGHLECVWYQQSSRRLIKIVLIWFQEATVFITLSSVTEVSNNFESYLVNGMSSTVFGNNNLELNI